MLQLKAPDAVSTLGFQSGLLAVGEVQGGAVINRWSPHTQKFLALEVQFRGRLPRLVEPPHSAQLIRSLRITAQPFGLALHPVPGQTEPRQVLLDRVGVFLL